MKPQQKLQGKIKMDWMLKGLLALLEQGCYKINHAFSISQSGCFLNALGLPMKQSTYSK